MKSCFRQIHGGGERPSDFDVARGIEPLLQGQLHDGNIGGGPHQLAGDEDAVVETTCIIPARGEPARSEQVRHLCRQRGRARRGVGKLIGVRRKAIVIVDELGVRRGGDAEGSTLPLRGNDHDGLGHSGQTAIRPPSQRTIAFQVSGGFQSMTQGPAPWGM